MSLIETHHSKSWNAIPRKCKDCLKAIYVTEKDGEVLYQCSIYGTFKRDCSVDHKRKDTLPTPKQVRGIIL